MPNATIHRAANDIEFNTRAARNCLTNPRLQFVRWLENASRFASGFKKLIVF